MENSLNLSDVLLAQQRIRPYLKETPLVAATRLGERIGMDVWLKCEYALPTRAFKVRGGLNLVGVEAERVREVGLTAASTGNHGQSIAYAGRLFSVPVTIFAPEEANPTKVQAMRSLGATVKLQGQDFDEAREACEAFSAETGARYVHSMNEPLLIAGVGTMYWEVLTSLPQAEVLIVPVGGGSGVASAGLVAKSVNPAIRVIGVQAQGAPAVYESFKAGQLRQTKSVATSAEGLATRVAFDLPMQFIRRYVDDMVLVSDESIRQAQALIFEETRTIVEMAGAAGVAALMQLKDTLEQRRIVVALTGANPSIGEIRQVWERIGSV